MSALEPRLEQCRQPGPLRRIAARAAPVLLLGAVAVAGTGCLVESTATLQTTAYFHDVSNLVNGAPVEMAGVTVGNVRSISLRGNLAEVVMSVDKSAGVPSEVSAKVEQSTVLGEEVVELVPSAKATGRLLADGSTISDTAEVPGIQQFVAGGTAVIGAIGTSQLAALVDAGGQGLGGQTATLRGLISYLQHITAGYSTRTTEIKALVIGMDRLSSSLAPAAAPDTRALARLASTIGVLSRQSGNFVHLLQGLDRLSIEGRSLMEQQLAEIDLQFRGLAGITATLAGQQRAIAQLVEQLPGHNAVMHDVTVNHFVQIVDALIVCGLPNGGGDTTQPAASCHGAGGSGGPASGSGPGGGLP
ncbi:MAG: MlaD family protein [Actinomycetota bacterium]|nr:MlaD family protein [Actinomycetota bacterium]